MHNAASKIYQQFSDQLQQKFFLDLISGIEKRSGLRFLDLGCGTGNNTILLRNLTDSNGKIIAIDPIEERINIAFEKYNDDLVSFHCASGRDLLRYASDIDVVISNVVIHWIPRDEKKLIFDAVFKSLKPGGKFLFNSGPKLPFYFEKFMAMLPKKIRDRINKSLYFENDEYFRDLALKCGFEVIKFEKKFYDFPFDGTSAEFMSWMASTLCVVEFDEIKATLSALEKEIEEERLKNGSISFQSSKQNIYLNKPWAI